MFKLKQTMPSEVVAALVQQDFTAKAGEVILIAPDQGKSPFSGKLVRMKREIFLALYDAPSGLIAVPEHVGQPVRVLHRRRGSTKGQTFGPRYERAIPRGAARQKMSRHPSLREVAYLGAVVAKPGGIASEYCYAAEPSMRDKSEADRSVTGNSVLIGLCVRGLITRTPVTRQFTIAPHHNTRGYSLTRRVWAYSVTQTGLEFLRTERDRGPAVTLAQSADTHAHA
jgi:hypothetical protein